MQYFDTYLSPLGVLTICSDGHNITGLWMEKQKHFALPVGSIASGELRIIQNTKQWLDAYFAGENPTIAHIPLQPAGTPFQQQVWQKLMEIPYGQTVTYGQIAATFKNQKMSAQAVGNAVGRNPICILIPCHRVVGANGLCGYVGGIKRKEYLLRLEKAEVF